MEARLDALQLDMDPYESALSTGYKVNGLVAHEIMPVYTVPERTFKAPVYGIEGFELVDAKRALHAEPNEVSWAVSYQTGALEERALQVPVDTNEEEAAAVAGISLRDRARMTATRHVAISREYAAAQELLATGTYDTGNSETITEYWDDMTTAPQSDYDPLVAIDAAKEVVRGKIGVMPNFCLMGRATWNAFKKNSYIVNAMPGGTGADSTIKRTTLANAKDLLDMERLIIAGSTYHTGAAFADIWGDCFIMAYQNPNPTETEEPTFGFTLTRQTGEADGVPILGAAGSWQKSPWVTGVYYQEWSLNWVAMDTAGYLMLDCVA